MHPTPRLAAHAALAALVLGACSVDRNRSPVCGMALLVGPNLIVQQFTDARALLSDAPRGLPGSLPVRVTGQSGALEGRVTEGADGNQFALELDSALIPTVSVDSTGRDSTVYGVLLVDDSTAIVHGVLIYEQKRPPEQYPRVGTLTDPRHSIPVYGLRVSWREVSNPRCPLFGNPAP